MRLRTLRRTRPWRSLWKSDRCTANITPHVCRHTYCSNQAKAGMNPKTLQYLMGHSDIGVTLNTYTHLGLEDAAEELRRMEEAEAARREQEKIEGKAVFSQKMFTVV